MVKSLAKNKLAGFVAELEKEYQIYLPLQQDGGDFLFQPLVDFDLKKLSLENPMTILPPSVFFLPLREKILKIKQGQYIPRTNSETKVLLGLSTTDVRAIYRLDLILKKTHQDFFYQQNRENTIIVGIQSGKPTSLFDRVLTPEKLTGFDLLLEPDSQNYLVLSGSAKGDELLEWDLFGQEIEIAQTKKRLIEPLLNMKKITWAVEKTKGGKVWQKWSQVCLGCGICSYTCPLCFCYQLKDQISLKGKIDRTREQSSCFLYDFDQMAGNSNPREEFVDRFYHWYHHKFVQMPKEFGFSGCVNCGRCVKYCPAGINFRQVLTEVVEEAENG